MEPVVIFGAGKIARGFINHLLALSGYRTVFIEKSRPLCDLIRKRKEYSVHILGNSDRDMKIGNADAICLDDVDQAAECIAKTGLIFTAVGGKNLGAIVPVLVAGIRKRMQLYPGETMNVITCENWKKPAEILQNGVSDLLNPVERQWLEEHVGFSEAVVMRSAIEADEEALAKDPLVVNVQDFWELPVDAERLKGEIPAVEGIRLMQNFGGFLERKFYTYNAANGTVSYVGSILGYDHIAPASRDPYISELLDKVYAETTEALCRKHGTSYEEQHAFALSSLRKLRDERIVDTLERNARDPIRKLSPDDRLVGSARLMMEYGVKPDGILTSIACAIFYNGAPTDESAQQLIRMRQTRGVDAVLREVCKINPENSLYDYIKQRIEELRKCDIIKEKDGEIY